MYTTARRMLVAGAALATATALATTAPTGAATGSPAHGRGSGSVSVWVTTPDGAQRLAPQAPVHFAGGGSTRTMIKNAHSTRGVSLVFNKQQLPWFTLWKDTAGQPDGYVTGLEPGTNFPNPRTFETAKERVIKLAPGQKQEFDVTVEVHGSPAEVSSAEAAVAKIQAGRQPKIFDQPQVDWCA